MSSARSNANLISTLEGKIRFRAYELYQQRGGEHGRALDDWLQAETDILRQKLGATQLRVTPAKRGRAKQNGN